MNYINFNKTKYIVLVLENCDEITIDIKDILSFSLSNIQTDYTFYNDGWRNLFMIQPVVNNFNLILKQSANKQHKQFGGAAGDDGKYTVFQRIKEHYDITQIKLLDKNWKEIKYYFVPYNEKVEGALGAPNTLETVSLHKEEFWEKKKFVKQEVLEISIKKK